MPDLIANLRALARSEHMDLSLSDDAANEIERLRAESADLYAVTHSALPANMLEAADPEHPVPGMAALGRAQQR